MTKKAFITGVAGQDGSILVDFLLNKGYQVYGLVREGSCIDNLTVFKDSKDFHIINGDLLNDDLIRFIVKTYHFDEVYNLASQSNIRLSYTNPVNTFNVTLIGTLILLENLKKYSPTSKVFQAGSSAMFGYSQDGDGFQREHTPFLPVNPYGSAKLFAYNISNNYRDNHKLFVVNGILYNHESYKTKTLPGIVSTIVKKALTREQFYIPNLKVNLDIGNAKDYIQAMWLTLQQEQCNNYVIASGVNRDIQYICEYVYTSLQLDYKQYITTDSNTFPTPFVKGDASRIKTLGWQPAYNLEQTIDEIIKHYSTVIN